MDIKQAIATINHSIDQYSVVTDNLPRELLTWKPDADKWSIMEVLCHVEEAIDYWLGEVNNLAQSPGTEWGRGLQHPGRLAAVANAGNRSFDEVLNRIQASKLAVESTLNGLSEQQLNTEAPSRNPRFGTKPMSFIIEHLMVEHLNTHIKQIQRNITEYPSA